MSNVTTLAALREPTQHAMTAPSVQAGFFDLQSFELMQRVAKGFASSSLVPQQYQGNVANTMIALSMAQRIGADPMAVMQQLHVINGRPSWSSKFLIATFNACGRFTAMRFRFRGTEGQDDWSCQAYATEKATGEEVNGAWVSIALAKAEGWHSKNGSKWKTMPQQMLMYRAASFMVNIVAPELSMGLQTAEEAHDIIDVTPESYSVEALRDPDTKPTSSAIEHQTTTAPEWPRANADGELVDVRGVRWDERIHSSSKGCNDDGTWRRRRGVDPALVAKIERTDLERVAPPVEAGHEHEPAIDGEVVPEQSEQPEMTYEQIRAGLLKASDEAEIDAWEEESQYVVISQSQRMALDQARDQRKRQLAEAEQSL